MKQKTKKRILLFSTILVLIIDLVYAINIYFEIINLESFGSTISLSKNSQIAFLSICAIVNCISVFLISKDLLKHKKAIIVLNIIQFLFGNLFNIISSIFNIIIISRKTTDVDNNNTKEKKGLPVLEDITKHKWYVYLLIFIFLLIICYSPITNLFLISFVGNIPTNQAIIYEWPIYISAFIAILIAPLTEELMFRGFMKKFIKNDVLFVILSSLVFGGLHVTVANSLSQVLFIIPYSILGLAFSLNYVKTRNIASNICLHSAWNSIAIIAMIITKLLLCELNSLDLYSLSVSEAFSYLEKFKKISSEILSSN